MKLAFFLAIFAIGVLAGFTYANMHTPTGAATATCFVDNEPCACDGEICQCGNTTIPSSYCRTENLNKDK